MQLRIRVDDLSLGVQAAKGLHVGDIKGISAPVLDTLFSSSEV